MADVKVNNMVKLHTLLLLQEEPQHGYHIIKKTGEKLGKQISPGEIYPFLSLLQKKKLVVVKSETSRDKKTYSLTSKGREFTQSLLAMFADIVHASVESKLKKCLHCGCEVYTGGYKKGRQMFCCPACASAYEKG